MNKILSRMLMLGALVGCMATAAWAGNVEVDMVGDGAILYPGAADGYYETNSTSVNIDSGEKSPVDTKLYFNGNGDVAWGSKTYAYGTATYRYEYDAKGNLLKSVEVVPTMQSTRVITESYTYNVDGDLTQSHYYSDWDGQIDDYTYYYEYADGKLAVSAKLVNESGDVGTRTIVYTLNENGDPVKREMTYQEGDLNFSSLEGYTYDEKGNLISVTEGEGDEREVTTYEYNDKNLCVKQTWTPSKNSAENYHSVPSTTTYEYDENGNVAKTTYGNDYYETYTYALIPDGATPSEFSDVQDTGAFYYDAVVWANDLKITTGVGDGKFAPDRGCTRDQLVTFLWRAAGEPEPETTVNPFTDVKESDYFYKAVLWAVENGVTTGKSETIFAPKETCTRAQIVTFIYRAAGEPKVDNAVNPFEDVAANAYYADAVLWAVENGITTGKTATRFAPNDTCTRGQGVTFLYRGIGLY